MLFLSLQPMIFHEKNSYYTPISVDGDDGHPCPDHTLGA